LKKFEKICLTQQCDICRTISVEKNMSWEQIHLNIYEERKMAENAFGKRAKYFSRFLPCIEAVVNKYQLTGSVGRAFCLLHE
jgi:predicted transcriptional regulator